MEQKPSDNRSTSLRKRNLGESGYLMKAPPQAVDLEETILGMAMIEINAGRLVIEKLIPDDFYKDEHRMVFEAMQELARNGVGINMKTVHSVLIKQNKDELVGGGYFLAELTSKVSSAGELNFYCHVLKEQTIKRALIQIGGEIIQKGYMPEQDAFLLLDILRKHLLNIDQGISGQRKESHIKDGIYKLAMQLQERGKQEQVSVLTGVPSGYQSIDRITQGFQNSDLIIIAGRPGMAKSSLAVAIGRNASVDFGIPTAIFSLEMSTPQLVNKIVSIETEIDLKVIRGDKFNPLEWDRFTNKTANLAKAPLYIDDSPGLGILDLRARCRRFKDEYKIGLIIVDYLQLIRGERSSRGNREEEIASISRTLKLIAKELDVPVIALSQLSREVEKRKGKMKPQLSDLRESGSIEQDADLVGFIWRPEYYKIEFDDDTNAPYPPGYTEVHWAKHRNGAQGTSKLQFIGKYTGFRNITGTSDTAIMVADGNPNPPAAPATAYPDTSDDMPF
jgi:replicative DNA helicase